MKKEYRIERLSENRLRDLHQLFVSTFKKKISFDFIRGKYITPLTDKNFIGFLAYDGSLPVAFYGAIPQCFRRGEERIYAAHISESMTLPGYQGQGLHSRLARMSYPLMEELGFTLAYGCHSEATFQTYLKLGGWEVARMLRACEISTRGILPVAGLLDRVGLSSMNLYHAGALKSSGPDKSLNAWFPNPWSVDPTCWSLEYNAAWFEYKKHSPTCVVQAGPLKAWIRIKTDIWVGAIEAGDEMQTATAIEALKNLARKTGATKVLFQMEPESMLRNVLEKHYTTFETFRLGYLMLNENLPCEGKPFHIDDLRFNFGDIDSF